MEYNQLIKEKLPSIIKRVLTRLSRFSENYEITNSKITIDDSGIQDLGTYVSTFTTCAFLVTVEYELNGEEWRDFTFEVPRMINGMFIIGGKYKLINRYLTYDNECIRKGKYLDFYYGFTLNLNTQTFYIHDDEEDLHEEVTFDELKSQYPEYLKLNEKSQWKLKIFYNLDKLPEILTDELVTLLINNPPIFDDSLNKRIISVDQILLEALRKSIKDITKSASHNFYQYGTISSHAFQGLIDKIFYNQGTDWNTINTSINVNPYSLDSVNQKVIIEDITVGRNTYSQKYNESLADIIDPVVTPDGINVGRINYLNNSTKVEEGIIYIKVLDKNFKELYIPYYKYVGSKIVLYQYIDYKKHEIHKPFKIQENRIDKDSDTFDFIQCHPDERLCELTRAIPMINFTDTVRLGMAARMITQAVPLANPDTPQIQSGHEGNLSNSTTAVRYEGTEPAEVINVTKEKVSISVNGIVSDFMIPTPNIGIYNLTTVFEPIVKVGDIVTSGQVLINERNSTSGTKNIGLNAFVAFMPYRGYNYEDGIIISESFARRLEYYTIEDVTIYLKSEDVVSSVLPKGSKVSTGDIIVNVTSAAKNKEVDKLLNMVTKQASKVYQRSLVTPANIDEAYIIDMKYSYDYYKEWKDQTNSYHLELNEESKEVLDKASLGMIKLPDEIPTSFRSPISEVPSYDGYAGCVTVRLLVKNKGRVGTKLASLYGAKGMVGLVLPDDQMLRTKEGKVVDCIINADAVFARKNLTQDAIMILSNIAEYILNVGRKEGVSKFIDLCKKYGLEQYADMQSSDIQSILDDPKSTLTYITGSYSRFTMEQLLDWMQELGVDNKRQMIDGKTNRPIRNPIICGNMYMVMVYKIPTHDNKVFTESSLSEPILGQGHIRRGGGMSIGEMELNGLFASDLDEFIYKVRNKFSFTDAQNLYINLALAGLTIGPKEEDILHDKLLQLKEKFRK
jgi:DNA-directed RNA polymerase beta subunit